MAHHDDGPRGCPAGCSTLLDHATITQRRVGEAEHDLIVLEAGFKAHRGEFADLRDALYGFRDEYRSNRAQDSETLATLTKLVKKAFLPSAKRKR